MLSSRSRALSCTHKAREKVPSKPRRHTSAQGCCLISVYLTSAYLLSAKISHISRVFQTMQNICFLFTLGSGSRYRMYKWQEGSHWATRKLLTRSPGKPLYTHLIEPPMNFWKTSVCFPSVMVKGSGAKHNDNNDGLVFRVALHTQWVH